MAATEGLVLFGGAPAYTNLITNPSFELGITNWAVVNGTGAASTAQHYSGTSSLAVTAPSNGVYAYTNFTMPAASQPVALSARVYSAAGGSFQLQVTDNIDLATSGSVVVVPAGVWTVLTVTETIDTHTAVQMRVTCQNASPTAFFVDAACATATASVVEAFDGDTLGAYWTGDPHASTSVLPASIDLNDGTTWTLEELDMPTPAKRAEWVSGADADGSLLVRDPLVENRTITARLTLFPQSTMNAALAAIEALSKKLEEAEAREGGLPLVWTPANSTTGSLLFYVLSATIVDIPKTLSGSDAGYFQKTPVVTVKFDCRPFGYESEVLYPSSTTSSLPLATLTLTGIPGDVPAEGRLIVTDNATQSRAHVEWGLEQRDFNATTPSNLLVDSDSMTVTGFSGAQTTRTGAYDPGAAGNNVIRATLVSAAASVCSTGNQDHVGTFRVKLRCYCTSTTIYVRLAWKEGDSPYTRGDYAQAVVVGWNDLDLGLLTVPVASQGSQRWVGVIEAYSTTTGDTLDVDVLELVPAGEGYGKGRAIADYATVSTYSAFDDFNQSAGALTGKSLGIGGTWQGAGDADDFLASGVTGGIGYAVRTAASDAGTSTATGRVVTASSPTTLTNVVMSSLVVAPPNLVYPDNVWQGLVARYTNISNYVVAFLGVGGGGSGLAGGITGLYVIKRVAGVETTLAVSAGFGNTVYMQLYFAVNAAGVFSTTAVDSNTGAVLGVVGGTDSALATGGALASGTVGVFDRNTFATAYQRIYDNFRAFAPTVDNVIWSGQTAEFRHDGALREDASGAYYGPIQTYRGARFLIPPAGDRGLTSRVAVKARRNDVDLQQDDNIADSTKIEVRYRARHLNVRGA